MSQPTTVHALLLEQTGLVLLVRRRGSLLWGLPGGPVRGASRLDELLTTYCQRQTGVAPDFAGAFAQFTLAGTVIAVAVDEAPKARAAARGRIESVQWFNRNELPVQIDPAVRIAIALLEQKEKSVEQKPDTSVVGV